MTDRGPGITNGLAFILRALYLAKFFHKPSKFNITIVTFNYTTTVIMGVFRYFLVKIKFDDHLGIIQ